MIDSTLLDILQCPTCHHAQLALHADPSPALHCDGCSARYPVVDGIPDLAPAQAQTPDPYRPETLSNLIAGIYDQILPLMSSVVWRCSPLRFADWAHMVAGRGVGGFHLSFPINTGRVYEHIWGEHLNDLPIIGVDQSWNMLRRARKNLRRAGIENFYLIRADPNHLPFKEGAFDTLFSLNGLHAFAQREVVWGEMKRVVAQDGLLAGSTLVREENRLTDLVLDFYERQGVTPMPRSKDYVVAELQEIADGEWFHESYGAVMFFGVDL